MATDKRGRRLPKGIRQRSEKYEGRFSCCFSHYLQLHVAHYLPPFSKLSQRFQHIIQSQLCILNTVIKKRSTLFNPNEFADCKNIRVFCNV